MASAVNFECIAKAKVMVLGGGGREHSLAWKLSQSPNVQKVYVNPGNGADFPVAPISISDVDSIISFCQKDEISLVVIGPEDLLFEGFVDKISQFVPCFGPSKEAAKLEWSKSYAKRFMRDAGISTADFQVFTQFAPSAEFISNVCWDGIVVKADGLAAGKGVIVCSNKHQALLASKEMLEEDKFGTAGHEIVIEQRLDGNEVSALCFTDGSTIRMLPLIKDYKKLLNNDVGPNTGGMGVIGPIRLNRDINSALENICFQTIRALREKNIVYRGILYVGVMITPDGVRVLEYNCRFGDPETEVLMRLLQSDLYEILLACCQETLDAVNPSYLEKCTCGIVTASEGYPLKPLKGSVISGISEAEEDESVIVYHAGTKRIGKKVVVNGGRVLCTTAVGSTFKEARNRAYKAVGKIYFTGMFYRDDIGDNFTDVTLSYADSGVSIEEGNQFVKEIKALCSAMKMSTTDTVGGFSALIDFARLGCDNSGDSEIEVGVDGVGSKLAIADELGIFETIGQDLVAMCANDVICHKAEPLAFLFYYGVGNLSKTKIARVLRSIETACEKIGCLVRGEVSYLPEIYSEEQWDIAGACIASRPKEWKRLPLIQQIEIGDVLIGIASNGLHSNGFSLVRKIFAKEQLSYKSACPWNNDLTFDNLLLRETRLYPSSVLPVVARLDSVLGVAHITGGGLKENVNRILPSCLKAVIDCMSWEIPEIFKWIYRVGPISCEEMMRTFNCGIGIVLVSKPGKEETIINLLRESGERAFRIGEVQKRLKDDEQVEFVNLSNGFVNNCNDVLSNAPIRWSLDENREIRSDSGIGSTSIINAEKQKFADDDVVVAKYCSANFSHDQRTNCVSFLELPLYKRLGFGTSRVMATMCSIGPKLAAASYFGGFYKEVGKSIVEVCANELVCCGASPKAFLDYYVTGRLCKSQAIEVIKAIAYACDEIGCALVGGETAEMPGIYQNDQWDLAGVCVGATNLHSSELPSKERLSEGDLLVGVASNGLQNDGFSHVLKICTSKKIDHLTKCPWDTCRSFGEVLLGGTKCYVNSVLPLLSKGLVLNAVSVNNGLSGCISKLIPYRLKAAIDCGTWEMPRTFEWIKFISGLPFAKMMQIFNCGIGMILACKPEVAGIVLQLLSQSKEKAFVMGTLQNNPGGPKVDFVKGFRAFRTWFGKAKPVNVAVMISGAGTNMVKLIESCLSESSTCWITLVISNREDAKGLKIAQEHGIETAVIPFVTTKQREHFEKTVVSMLEARSIDLICLAGFMRILSDRFVKRYHHRILNIHPSLLPLFKGAHAIEDALDAGVKETGCTVHYAIEEVDSGEIIAQETVPIFEGDTVKTLHERIQEKEHVLFPFALHKIAKQIQESKP